MHHQTSFWNGSCSLPYAERRAAANLMQTTITNLRVELHVGCTPNGVQKLHPYVNIEVPKTRTQQAIQTLTNQRVMRAASGSIDIEASATSNWITWIPVVSEADPFHIASAKGELVIKGDDLWFAEQKSSKIRYQYLPMNNYHFPSIQ